MKNFKIVITTNADEKVGQNQRKVVVKLPFPLRVEIDKNNQICDIQPRTVNGADLYSFYHGRVMNYYSNLVQDMGELING